jgi:XRE family aerobic/anaerobic benzoate catabolism transcriptional regulator
MEKDAKKYLKLLGARIVSLRKGQGLTQVQLAEKLGTEHAQIGRLERGETNCTIIILRRIAKELGVSVSVLLDIEEKPTKDKI